MKKILITGANSFVGTSLEKWLAQWPDQYQVETVDMIGEAWRVKDFSGFDTVFHVAGIAHSDTGKPTQQMIDLYKRVNCDLVIETAAKAKKDGARQFIFMSSIIVYGNSAPVNRIRVINAETEPNPENFYGNSKLLAEKGLATLAEADFRIAILRPPMIYGKGSKGNYPQLVKFALKLPLFPDIKNQRSMIYIENLTEFIRLIIDNQERGTFYPQNEQYVKTSEMVRLVALAHGKSICLTKIFNPLLFLLGQHSSLVSKAFGNLVYDHQMSQYHERYCSFDLAESLLRSEQ